MSERVRMCGGTWRFCDGDCNHCPKTYATNTTATISKEQLDEIKPPIVTKEQMAEMLGILKHGHWDKHYHEFDDDCYGGEWWAKCSECGYTEEVFARGHVCSSWNYCPRCGAKMDGEREQ